MATPVRFYSYKKDLAEKKLDLSNDVFKVALTNTLPDAATDAVFADIAEIAAGNGYTAGGTAANTASAALVGADYVVVLDDVVFTASGGSIGPFRYAVLYDDTPTSPADPLVAYADYGSAITLLAGEQFTVDFNAVTGALVVE